MTVKTRRLDTQKGWRTSDADEIELRAGRAEKESMQIERLAEVDGPFDSYHVTSASEERYVVEIRSLDALSRTKGHSTCRLGRPMGRNYSIRRRSRQGKICYTLMRLANLRLSRGGTMKRLWILGLVTYAGLVFAPAVAAQSKQLNLGTGAQAGVYHLTGEAICRIVNRDGQNQDLHCTAEVTPGSVFNLNQIRRGDLDVAIVQSDWQAHAYAGTDVFEAAGPDSALRSLFSLYPESLTIVAQVDSGIETFQDLLGKKLNVGQPGSGSRRTIAAVMAALGWKSSDFALVSDLKPDEVLGAFCNREFDAFAIVVAHPNKLVQEALQRCEGVVIPAGGDTIDRLITDHGAYVATTIPGADYGLEGGSIASFGVIATVVTSEQLDEETAYSLVAAVATNLERLKKQHPALRGLRPELIKLGNTAPLHPGAVRYFKEVGAL